MTLKANIEPQTATVYRAAGRRWLTLRGACNAAARKKVRERYFEFEDEEIWPELMQRYARMSQMLAAIYRIRYIKEQQRLSASDALNTER